MKRRETGILGEKLAKDYLKKRGYRIRESNYRCPEGEVDIIAKHGDYLVFVEVKTRRSLEFGSPEESITAEKRERLRSVAAHYQQAHDNLPQLWRIDVVAIELGSKNKPSRIELFENAVGED
jgi:putative endonuclease